MGGGTGTGATEKPIGIKCSGIGKKLHDNIYVCDFPINPDNSCRRALYNTDEDGSFGSMTLCIHVTTKEREKLLAEEECTNMRQYVGKVLGNKK